MQKKEEKEKKSIEAVADEPGFINVLDSQDEEQFELACAELANKNARGILHEISIGACSSPEIASRTGLTIQDVIFHLSRLEQIHIIEEDNSSDSRKWFPSSLRGRIAKHYRISKVAVLLIPNEIFVRPKCKDVGSDNKASFRENLVKKSAAILKKQKRTFTPIVLAIISMIILSLYISGSLTGTPQSTNYYPTVTGTTRLVNQPPLLMATTILAAVSLSIYLIVKFRKQSSR